MPLVLADRVRDTTTTTGTGTVTLSGTAPTGYQNFSVIGNGNTTYYTINAGSQWEVGIGTYSSTGPTLARTTVLESSNANARVDFAAGTKDVFVTYPADKSVNYDENNNVGIGISSPGAKLDVLSSGDTPLNIRSAGASTYLRLINSTNTEGYVGYVGSDLTLWATAERMRISGATGNVGIGTSSPTANLSVGDDSTTASRQISLHGPASGTAGGSSINVRNGTDTVLAVGNASNVIGGAYSSDAMLFWGNAALRFYGNSAERMRITAAGNVGIGTSSPGFRLDVSGTGRFTGLTQFDNDVTLNKATLNYLYFNDAVAFARNGVGERMRIDASGNVGIGISSPSYRLDVGTGTAVGTTAGNSISISRLSGGAGTNNVALQTTLNRISNGTDWQTTALRVQAQVDLTPFGYIDFLNGSSAAMTFGRATSEFMRIDSSGNVGIGTTSPGATLTVVTNTTSHNGMRVTNNSTTQFAGSGLQMLGPSAAGSQGGAGIYYYNTNVGGTTGALGIAQLDNNGNFQRNLAYYDYNSQFWGFATNNTERMRITSGGNVGIGTSAPQGLLHVVAGTNNSLLFRGPINYATGGSIYAVNSANSAVTPMEFGASSYFFAGGNVGIGTSAPGAPLQVVGAGRFGAGPADATNATLAMYNDGTGVSIEAFQGNNAATKRNLWLAAYGGNVGIGTNTPGVRLDVAGGSIRVGNTHAMTFRNAAGTGTATFTLQSDDNFVIYNAAGTPIQSFTQGANGFAVYGGNGNNRMVVDSGSNITYWIVNGSERARINSSGEFLVGTSSGGRSLCLFGSDVWQRIHNPSRSWLIGMGTGSNFNIFDETGGGTRLGIDTSGNWLGTNSIILGAGFNFDNRIEVGQGRTGNNFAYIDLIGDTTYTDFGLRLLRGNGGPNATSELLHRGTGDFVIGTVDAGVLRFSTNNTERMRFDSAGTALYTGLIVGRNSSGSNINTMNDTGSFSVRGDGSNAAAMSFHRTGAFAINMGLGTDAVFRIGGWSASSNCFQMDASGNLTMLGNVTAYSDARIKKDVETIGSALDLVSKMRGVRYTRIDSGKRGVGVIAQEMLEVLPEVVQQGVGDDDTLSVAYGNLVGVLIEAIKELRAEVAELKGK